MRKWTSLFVFITLVAASCDSVDNGKNEKVKGNGQVTSENRNAGGTFTGVSTLGNFNVYLSIGNTPSVKIEGESNILPYIETYVDKGSLMVRSKDNVSLNTDQPVKVYITAPQLNKIESEGNGDIVGETPITDAAKIELQLKGNGNVKLDVDAPNVEAVIGGTGSFNLKGQTKTFDCKIMGNGSLSAFDLQTEETKLAVLGNGDAEVNASVKLDVTIAGNGNVKYKGNVTPAKTITGNGSITQVQ
jgi:hypothetical protein